MDLKWYVLDKKKKKPKLIKIGSDFSDTDELCHNAL